MMNNTIIEKLHDNYFTILKQQGLAAAVMAVTENASDAIIEEIGMYPDFDLINEYLEAFNWEKVYPMESLDEYHGRMYPTEFLYWMSNDFDMDDEYFNESGESDSDLYRLTGLDESDLATAILDRDVYTNTTSNMDEIVEDAHSMIEELQEYAARRDKAVKVFESLVTADNADILINAVWQAMQE